MKYYLYGNKIYRLSTKDSSYCHQLSTSGFWFWREVIRGHSGIADFGAYIGPISDDAYNEIIKNGIEWSREKIKKRLRYSIRDGGRMFDSFRYRVSYIKLKIKQSLLSFANIR